MSVEQNTVSPESAADSTSFVKKRAPTLYAISLFKLIKGAFFLGLAASVYVLSDNDLPAEFQRLINFLGVQAESRFWSSWAAKVGQLTEWNLIWTSIWTFVYSLFALVEGVGLLLRVSWAGWLAIGESALFIPLEVFELMKKFRSGVFSLLLINVVIVWYLVKNRHRLFRHHHH